MQAKFAAWRLAGSPHDEKPEFRGRERDPAQPAARTGRAGIFVFCLRLENTPLK